MKLGRAAQSVVAAAVVGGAAVLVWALAGVPHGGALSSFQWVTVGVVGVLMVAGWVWPLMVFVGNESKGNQFDEYGLIVLILFVPAGVMLVTLAAAATVAQIVLRRPLVKSAFNVGQVLLAAGAGAAVFRAVSIGATGRVELLHQMTPVGGHVDTAFYVALAAAVSAGLTYTVVNAAAVSAIVAAIGASWRAAVGTDLDTMVMFSIGSMVVAITTAVIAAADPWLFALAVLPPLLLRFVLADQFEARRDRFRVRALFEATLDTTRHMDEAEVTEALTSSARMLLRTTEAIVTDDADAGVVHAALAVPGREGLWLAVDGRSRTEPFDSSDQALLDALAAVGSSALGHAWLYETGREQRERLDAITSSMGEGVCALTGNGEVTFVNPAARSMLGLEAVGARAPAYLLGPARRALSTGSTVASYDSRFERADGTYFHVAFTASPIVKDDARVGVVVVFRDITERKEFEEQLARHAFHDSLTGLPNRRLFLDHLDHALRRSTRSSERHAVLFCDVDRFKIINDSLGHYAGDQLLVAIAERMHESLRPGDVLARFGGDEFTVLLEQVNGSEDAVAAARRILDQMRKPITLPDGHEVVATMSIGIAVTMPGMTRDDLLHDADVAMYKIKGKGRGGQFEVFDAEAMGVRSAERIELEAALRRAIAEQQLEVYYQPLFSVRDRNIVGAEALVRWHHPEMGMLPPSSFIGLAEDSGLILPLGRQVLEAACNQARRWARLFKTQLVVGVNLSARQFQQAGLVEEVESILAATGVDPQQLCLEITESLAMEDTERSREILLGLKALGVKVAIDDFGTGFSALGYLTDFPVDVVKIDRSFVVDVETDPVKSAIVSAVINLSDAIGTTTVVEGVETGAQLEHLLSLGCPEAQGYHLARPMTASDMDKLLAADAAGRRNAAPKLRLVGSHR